MLPPPGLRLLQIDFPLLKRGIDKPLRRQSRGSGGGGGGRGSVWAPGGQRTTHRPMRDALGARGRIAMALQKRLQAVEGAVWRRFSGAQGRRARTEAAGTGDRHAFKRKTATHPHQKAGEAGNVPRGAMHPPTHPPGQDRAVTTGWIAVGDGRRRSGPNWPSLPKERAAGGKQQPLEAQAWDRRATPHTGGVRAGLWPEGTRHAIASHYPGDGMAAWAPSPDLPPPKPTSDNAKRTCVKGARRWILGTATFVSASDPPIHPPTLPQGYTRGGGSGLQSPQPMPSHRPPDGKRQLQRYL